MGEPSIGRNLSEKIDLAKVEFAAELGPRLEIEVIDSRAVDPEDMSDYFRLRKEWVATESWARAQVGDAVRFVGPLLQDSPILDAWRSGSNLDLIVSEDWATNFAGWYYDRLPIAKKRPNLILPIRFTFSHVTYFAAFEADWDDDGRLLPMDLDEVLLQAEEFLWTQIISVGATHVQSAIYLTTHGRKRYDLSCVLLVVEAEQMRIRDRRRKAWQKIFGKDSLHIFDRGDEMWLNDPASIVRSVQ